MKHTITFSHLSLLFFMYIFFLNILKILKTFSTPNSNYFARTQVQEENAPKIANIMCSFCWCGVIRLSKRPATTIYLKTMPLTPCFQVKGSPAGAASTNLSSSARICSNLVKMVSGDNVYLFIYLRRLVFAGVKESRLVDADGS